MGRKLRIAILYNEPVTASKAERQYISETGQLKETRSPLKQSKAAERKQADAPVLVDLSEVGVVEEMDDIKAALSSLGYKPTTLSVDDDIFRLIEYLRDERPDLIFNIVESLENESVQEMNVAGLYELLKILDIYNAIIQVTIIVIRKAIVPSVISCMCSIICSRPP